MKTKIEIREKGFYFGEQKLEEKKIFRNIVPLKIKRDEVDRKRGTFALKHTRVE